jgi:hypothetical protein
MPPSRGAAELALPGRRRRPLEGVARSAAGVTQNSASSSSISSGSSSAAFTHSCIAGNAMMVSQ